MGDWSRTEEKEKKENILEEFKDFIEWLETVPEPIRKTRPIEILYLVYAHERKKYGKYKQNHPIQANQPEQKHEQIPELMPKQTPGQAKADKAKVPHHGPECDHKPLEDVTAESSGHRTTAITRWTSTSVTTDSWSSYDYECKQNQEKEENHNQDQDQERNQEGQDWNHWTHQNYQNRHRIHKSRGDKPPGRVKSKARDLGIKKKETPPEWSEEEIETLIRLYPITPTKELSKILRRSEDAIRSIASSLKIRKKVGIKGVKTWRRWTEKEIEFLRENYLKLSNREIANILGRSKSSVQQKARELGLGTKDFPTTNLLRDIFRNAEGIFMNGRYIPANEILQGEVY